MRAGTSQEQCDASSRVIPRRKGRSSRTESKQSTTEMIRAVIGICSSLDRQDILAVPLFVMVPDDGGNGIGKIDAS